MNSFKLVLNKQTTFKKAVSLLDKNGNGVLPVVDDQNKLIGLITDGDIRKAILNKNLDLEHIINQHPFKYTVDSTPLERMQFLKQVRRRHLPLVDDSGCYVDLFVLDDVEFNSKANAVVVMAGGLGTRLGKLTKDIPKPMLHVGKKPILETIIENFIEYGFYKFYIAVNYKSEKIVDYFQDGKKWGIEVTYLHEDKRLGTAGALSLIEEDLSAPFLVTNGDVITTLNYENLLSFHEEQSAIATMCTREHEYTMPYGVVEVDGVDIKSLEEKPVYQFKVNAGVYVLEPKILPHIPLDSFFDMPSLFEKMVELEEKTVSFTIDDYWIDIGYKSEFDRANKDFNEF